MTENELDAIESVLKIAYRAANSDTVASNTDYEEIHEVEEIVKKYREELEAKKSNANGDRI